MIQTAKKELAQAYCPVIDHTAALKKLNHWIRTNTELSARLAATGYIATQRRFTPQQVTLLYHYLGEPFQLSEEVPQNSFCYFVICHFVTNKENQTKKQYKIKTHYKLLYYILYYNIIYNIIIIVTNYNNTSLYH